MSQIRFRQSKKAKLAALSALGMIALLSLPPTATAADKATKRRIEGYEDQLDVKQTEMETANEAVTQTRKDLEKLKNAGNDDLEYGSGGCHEPCAKGTECSAAATKYGISRTSSSGGDACVMIFRAAGGNRASITDRCWAMMEGCGTIQKQRKQKALEAKLESAEEEAKHLKTETAQLERKIDKLQADCVDCRRSGGGLYGGTGIYEGGGGVSDREPTMGESIVAGLSAITPMVLGGLNTYEYSKGIKGYYGAYNNQLKQCTTIGVPCPPPGYGVTGLLPNSGFGGIGGIGIGGIGIGGLGIGGGLGVGGGLGGLVVGGYAIAAGGIGGGLGGIGGVPIGGIGVGGLGGYGSLTGGYGIATMPYGYGMGTPMLPYGGIGLGAPIGGYGGIGAGGGLGGLVVGGYAIAAGGIGGGIGGVGYGAPIGGYGMPYGGIGYGQISGGYGGIGLGAPIGGYGGIGLGAPIAGGYGGIGMGGYPGGIGGYPGGIGGIGGYPGGIGGIGGYPGGIGGIGGYPGGIGGIGGYPGGIGGIGGYPGGIGGGYGPYSPGGVTGPYGGFGSGYSGGYNPQYGMLQQASLNSASLDYQRAQQGQQDIMIGAQAAQEAQSRYYNTIMQTQSFGGYGGGLGRSF